MAVMPCGHDHGVHLGISQHRSAVGGGLFETVLLPRMDPAHPSEAEATDFRTACVALNAGMSTCDSIAARADESHNDRICRLCRPRR